ncbi:hypothetical protein BH09ACT3_BH09ACT3_11270 [soil metagenome]
MEIFWVVFFIVVVGGVMAFLLLSGRKKVARYQNWAAANGWQYVRRDDSRSARWTVRPFTLGQKQRIHHVLDGERDGHAVSVFEHEAVNKVGETSVYRQTVLTTALPGSLPPVLIAPQRTPERKVLLAELGKDYEVEWAEFNREWFIRTDDLRFTSDFVHPQLMERLMKPDAKGLFLRVEGSDLIGWLTGARDELALIENQLPVLLDVVRLIPGFVWKDYGRA